MLQNQQKQYYDKNALNKKLFFNVKDKVLTQNYKKWVGLTV